VRAEEAKKLFFDFFDFCARFRVRFAINLWDATLVGLFSRGRLLIAGVRSFAGQAPRA
jgi:hypothetical protein